MSVIHDQICRLCAEINRSTEDILENNLKEMAELIYRYLSITVDTFAGISTKICSDCKEKILNFHNFALKCERAQSFLFKNKSRVKDSFEYRELKSEFDLQIGIKEEKDISDVDYFDDVGSSHSISTTETKINPENELLIKTTPSKKRKTNTRIISKCKTSKRRKCTKSEVFLTLPIEYEKMTYSEKDEMTINENVININKPRISKRCKSNTSQISSALPNKEEKMGDNDDIEKTFSNDNEEKMDTLNNIKGNQKGEIIVNGNVINVKKPIKDVATVKEILKLSEDNEVDIKSLELPNTVLKKARISQMFKFDCHMCEMKFDEWISLYHHTKGQHQTIPEVICVCNKKLKTYSTMLRHYRIHTPEESENYRCNICLKVSVTKPALEYHMSTHSKGPKIYGCDQCDKKFSSPKVVQRHKKIHEPEEKRYMFECSMCAKKFTEKSSLQTHINGVHKRIKRFTCDICGNSFASNDNLINHIQTHSEEMTCMCDICDRGFKTKLSLKSHIKKIHGNNVSYTCPHCSKVLKSRATYRNHLLIHDEYPRFSCSFCDKRFKLKKNLIAHKRIHTGERSSCLWCPKTFTNPSNYSKHKAQAHEIELREYELKMLKEKEEFAKKLREKLAGTSSKMHMANNVPISNERALKTNM